MRIFNEGRKSNLQKIGELKKFIRDLLGLPRRAVVLVSELDCALEDCPPVQTVVTVLEDRKEPRQFRWHKEIDQMTFQDLTVVLVQS